MRVILGCERSGVMRRAFRALGHDAWSCDLLPAADGSEFHIRGDIRDLPRHGWDLAIFFPDCTYICNSGVRWLDNPKPGQKVKGLTGPERWRASFEACELFRFCLNFPAPRVAVENPIPHKYAVGWIGRRYDCTVQPYEHSDPFTKRTCFWLRNLAIPKPTNIIPKDQRIAACHLASPGDDRGQIRSETYPGLASALAATWGGIVP